MVIPWFFELRLQKTLQKLCSLQDVAEHVEKTRVFFCFCAQIAQIIIKHLLLQYFPENIGKPQVFLSFCIQRDQKQCKTVAFCNSLLNMLKNGGFPLFFRFGLQKTL